MRLALMGCCLLLVACGGGAPGGGGDEDGGGPGSDGDVDHDGAIADAAAVSRVEGYVRAEPYQRLVIEVDSVAGMEPRSQVSAGLEQRLSEILAKPGGVEVVEDGVIASRGSDYAWSDAELFALADESWDLDVGDDTITMHAMFVDGHSERDTNSGTILGLAWGNTHMVIFKESIESHCASQTLPPNLREELCRGAERAIWTHEIGHVIGLVNVGLPMVSDHSDPDHPAHDESDDCVMYWAYEGSDLIGELADRLIGGGSASIGFDDACLEDIAAVRDAP